MATDTIVLAGDLTPRGKRFELGQVEANGLLLNNELVEMITEGEGVKVSIKGEKGLAAMIYELVHPFTPPQALGDPTFEIEHIDPNEVRFLFDHQGSFYTLTITCENPNKIPKVMVYSFC